MRKNFENQFKSFLRAFLATFCVRYPHAMAVLRNKVPYLMSKPSKPHDV